MQLNSTELSEIRENGVLIISETFKPFKATTQSENRIKTIYPTKIWYKIDDAELYVMYKNKKTKLTTISGHEGQEYRVIYVPSSIQNIDDVSTEEQEPIVNDISPAESNDSNTQLSISENKNTVNKIFKSPLKWAGGKSALIPKMREIWNTQLSLNPRLVWVDLFAGGLSLPLALQPKEAIINDNNKHLMDFWCWVRDYGWMSNLGFQNTEEYYYQLREAFNRTPTPENFYYLNRTCFNGLCRYSKSGKFNTPFGQYKKVEYRQDFTEYQPVIKQWNLATGCFRNIPLYPEYFVFCDPPYDDGFTGYSSTGFDWEDQIVLAKKLAAHRGISIVTNKATERILRLYKSLGFDIELIEMPRRIAANGNRQRVMEMFATKNLK